MKADWGQLEEVKFGNYKQYDTYDEILSKVRVFVCQKMIAAYRKRLKKIRVGKFWWI